MRSSNDAFDDEIFLVVSQAGVAKSRRRFLQDVLDVLCRKIAPLFDYQNDLLHFRLQLPLAPGFVIFRGYPLELLLYLRLSIHQLLHQLLLSRV